MFFFASHSGFQILGLSGYIRVDGTAFQWIGAEGIGNSTTLADLIITPTRTTLIVQAGPNMSVNATFLSPIEVHISDFSSKKTC